MFRNTHKYLRCWLWAETAVLPSLRKGDLDQCGIAFSFYYLEACRAFRQKELFLARLERYLQTADQPDMRT